MTPKRTTTDYHQLKVYPQFRHTNWLEEVSCNQCKIFSEKKKKKETEIERSLERFSHD